MEYSHDPRVSNKPDSEKFSYSVKGEAFFMLVLHPKSPRFARRFSVPTVVFNAHQQFEDLRKKNIFEKVRDLIRKRDKFLQGYINPMLVNYGIKSETFQYTGELYEKTAQCPFKRFTQFWRKDS
jgi:FPC/CPF motif-containing protein YcgG